MSHLAPSFDRFATDCSPGWEPTPPRGCEGCGATGDLDREGWCPTCVEEFGDKQEEETV